MLDKTAVITSAPVFDIFINDLDKGIIEHLRLHLECCALLWALHFTKTLRCRSGYREEQQS